MVSHTKKKPNVCNTRKKRTIHQPSKPNQHLGKVTKAKHSIKQKTKSCEKTACTFDFHENTPSQALSKLERFLPHIVKELKDDETVELITGWGKHCKRKTGPVIKPVVEAFLKAKGYTFEYANKGCIRLRKASVVEMVDLS